MSLPGPDRSPLFVTHGRDIAHDPAVTVTLRDLIQMAAGAAVLQPLRTLSARARRAGGHVSRMRGRGMDYEESRAYQPGDDIRTMDWRVTARAGAAHIKLFREERERPVVLVVDLGPGMFFASRGALKAVQAAHAAALIGWAAIAQGDRAGALLYNGGHREIEPRGGRGGILRIIRALAEHAHTESAISPTFGHDHFGHALMRLRRLVRPGSMVFLISDFYTVDQEHMQHLAYLNRHSEVIALRVLDILETTAPPPGRYVVTDGLNRVHLDLQSSAARRRHEQLLVAHHAAVAESLKRHGIALLQLTTSDAVTDAIAGQVRAVAPRRRAA